MHIAHLARAENELLASLLEDDLRSDAIGPNALAPHRSPDSDGSTPFPSRSRLYTPGKARGNRTAHPQRPVAFGFDGLGSRAPGFGYGTESTSIATLGRSTVSACLLQTAFRRLLSRPSPEPNALELPPRL